MSKTRVVLDRQSATVDAEPVFQVEDDPVTTAEWSAGDGDEVFPVENDDLPLTDEAPHEFPADGTRFGALTPEQQATVDRINGKAKSTALAKKDESLPLLKIEQVRALLEQCVQVDEVKDIRDRSVAIVAYYRERDASLECQNAAAELRLRSERRLGELLKDMPKHPGGRPAAEDVTCKPEIQVSTLDEIGITRMQSSVWQRIAALPEADFDERIADAKENGLELTTSRVLRGKPPAGTRDADPDTLAKLQRLWSEATAEERRDFLTWAKESA